VIEDLAGWHPLDVPLAQAIRDFDARQYEEEYIELRQGDAVELIEAPGGEVADAQWSYGRVGTLQGWFPTAYIVRRSQGRTVYKRTSSHDDTRQAVRVDLGELVRAHIANNLQYTSLPEVAGATGQIP
jgi:hypothetical protein